MTFQPGQSGNPIGRPRRKVLTNALLRALALPWDGRRNESGKQMIVRRLLGVIAKGEDKDVIKAAELVWKYTEGMPVQTVEIDFEQALDDIAARTGAPRTWLVQRARDITARHMLEAGHMADDDREDVPTVVRPKRGRVMAVPA